MRNLRTSLMLLLLLMLMLVGLAGCSHPADPNNGTGEWAVAPDFEIVLPDSAEGGYW
jgi:hypothetical protein